MVDVGCLEEKAMTIMCDIQGCIALAKDPKHHSHTKHIDIQHHFIRVKFEEEVIDLKYYATQDIIADVLTKGLAKDRHQIMMRAMRLVFIDTTQRGNVGDIRHYSNGGYR